MAKKYKITAQTCNRCGGLITWDYKINNKFPGHVNKEGFLIGIGDCPSFKKSKTNVISDKIEFHKTEIFNRFNIEDNSYEFKLPIFQENTAYTPRFYIGSVPLNFSVRKKILKMTHQIKKSRYWQYGFGIIRKLFSEETIVSFFRIIEPDEQNVGYIYIYVIDIPEYKNADLNDILIRKLNDLEKSIIFTSDNIVNSEDTIETITSTNINNYSDYITHFFAMITYPLKYKLDNGEYIRTINHDKIEDNIYYFTDLDVQFQGVGKQVSKQDEGKNIFGALKDKKKKYRLIEITDYPINQHLKGDLYQEFLEYSRNVFEQKGYSRTREDGNDWILQDFWEKINDIKISGNDNIALVEDRNEKKFYFPQSRLLTMIKEDIPKEKRFMAIQKAKLELLKILKDTKNMIDKISCPLEIILLKQLRPKFYDLVKYPMFVEFANGVELELKRKGDDPYLLSNIPQELLKFNSNKYLPIARAFDFNIIPIIPSDSSSDERKNSQLLMNDISKNLKICKLADNVIISDTIEYTWSSQDIKERKLSKWAIVFEKDIKPKLIEINKTYSDKDITALTFFSARDLGKSSRSFKYYLQNLFYESIKKGELNKKHFSIIQGFKMDKYLKYGGLKLAVMSYKNSLFNIAANCPESKIAQRTKNGIIFKSKYPFGTRDIKKPVESIEMIAGFDASKIEGEENSKPRGAVIVTLDPYGKQLKSSYIKDALTHKGRIGESVIKDLILEIFKHQKAIIEEEKDKEPEFPRKILFLYDGDIESKQRNLFIKVYKNIIESGAFPTLPELILFEVLKSHPIRMYLYGKNKVFDVPFGTMALLNDREFSIKSHIWQKGSMPQPQLYRFKMRLSERYKNIVRYDISGVELVNIAVQLYQSTLFNTGKSGRPLKQAFVIHESHKLSLEFAGKPDSIGILNFKE